MLFLQCQIKTFVFRILLGDEDYIILTVTVGQGFSWMDELTKLSSLNKVSSIFQNYFKHGINIIFKLICTQLSQ